MAKHLFLTGEKGVGKSTLLQRALWGYQGQVGGFRTLRTDTCCPDGWSVHLFGPGEDPVPRADNLLFVCGGPQGDTPGRFDRLGCRALQRSGGCSLLVLDELGPHEARAAEFRRAVLALLDGDIPVLGVLQAPAGAFWPEILRHPDTALLEVTRQNRGRGEVLERIQSVIPGLSAG